MVASQTSGSLWLTSRAHSEGSSAVDLQVGDKLWELPKSQKAASQMTAFASTASTTASKDLGSWQALHRWSVTSPGPFWRTVADFCAIKWQSRPCATVYQPPAAGKMLGARWFEGSTLNFAENLLPDDDDTEVLVSLSEGSDRPPRRLTGRALRRQVAQCAQALRKAGVRKGDRVAGVITNASEAVACMLAATSIGAVWSSCSPDFGVDGVVDRLGQIEPKVLFFSLGYWYNGKYHDCSKNLGPILSRIPGRPLGVGVPYWGDDSPPTSKLPEGALLFQEFLTNASLEAPLHFEPTPFDHPVYIMFSSGTTGLPKCMVHGAGGVLLQHKKELMLHADMRSGDRHVFFTTTGWMMWNWAASTLAVKGACLVTYEGSPGYPDLQALWRVAQGERLTHLGISPKFLASCMQKGVSPIRDGVDLAALRVLMSTGSPLLPEHFQWVYQDVKPDVHLASISGGTDILGCFMLGNPNLPVRAGEIQGPGLGMDICAWDDTTKQPVVGQKAELVCRTPFPSMPVRFWADPGDKKYTAAYFNPADEPQMWRHGDYIEVTKHGGVVVHGRSDATLNPGGVRIGTAEIYRRMELVKEVEHSCAVGRKVAGDEEIYLFVKLAAGQELTKSLQDKIRKTIRETLTARHVPKCIMAVPDIPHTRSGKTSEVAVSKAINGAVVDNTAALTNPECMQVYYDIALQLNGPPSRSRL